MTPESMAPNQEASENGNAEQRLIIPDLKAVVPGFLDMVTSTDEKKAEEIEEKLPVKTDDVKLEERQEPEPEKAAPVRAPAPVSKSKGGPVIIVLVNPKSGGNAAGPLLKLPADGLLVEGDGAKATVFTYPIADPEKRGVNHLADEVEAAKDKEPMRCIVAGGDGTVMWAIEEIFKAAIPTSRVWIGTMPFGTGNDFGNVTKWGVSGPPAGFLKDSDGFKGLVPYVQKWLRADTHPYDIWEISVKTRGSDKAGFKFIDGKEKKCTDAHIARHHIKKLPDGSFEMSKYVCNYVGFGLDARVGIGFDKLRAGHRILNKVVYGYEGIKKLLFKKKGVIGHIVDQMHMVQGDNLQHASDGHDRAAHADLAPVFSTRPGASAQLVGNPVGLLFLNIPSLAGGLDVWAWSNRKLGAKGAKEELLKAKQNFGDGKLECLTWRTGLGFYAEQVRAPPISGQGHRVFSEHGPVRVSFREPNDPEYIKGTEHCKGRTYMQVDGEFIIVHEPDTVVLKHHATITVLVNADPAGCC